VLKIFLDCEKCVFVLAIDYNVVVSGVKSKYGTDFDENKGRSFFDKISQVPFKMPVAQYDISTFVKKTYEAVTATQAGEKDIANYVALINSSIGSNPRSMKRLFNSYFLLLKVVDKNLLDKDSLSKKALFAILCMQQHFESLYNHIVSNREEIGADFFNELAVSDRVEVLLRNEDIAVKAGEPERIQDFMRWFNKTLSASGEDEQISAENVDRLRLVLKSSSVTATAEASGASERKRLSFTYNGNTYKSRGANKMNLGNFALRLISDYAGETNMTAQELRDFINGQILPYATLMRKLNLGLIVKHDEPQLKRKDVQPYFFMDKADALRVGDETMHVQNSWGGGELNVLIDILGFRGRVICD
jgi:hypothetical protein